MEEISVQRNNFPNFELSIFEETTDEEINNVFDEVFMEKIGIKDKEKVSRFAKLSSEEVDDIVSKSETKHTKENTKWALAVFEGRWRYYAIENIALVEKNIIFISCLNIKI